MEESNVHNISESIKHEIIILNINWNIYNDFFVNENRQVLLYKMSPIVFFIFQRLLLNEVGLTLCRLTDPAQQGKNKNNSMYQLLSILNHDTQSLEELKLSIEPVRSARNKFLAHSDLDEHIKNYLNNTSNGVTELLLNFPLSVVDTDKAIKMVGSIFNQVKNECHQFSAIKTSYGPDGGVKRMIDLMKSALFYEKLEKEGIIDPGTYYESWQKFEHKNA
ncbi:hypothetical protein [Vibrio injensis]|uniref:AbiU2 domain-containing protein n=1 Tax=Vibrio injensis TaxID=1307414 RepID=UPI000933A621|nr:hypothetical protein [Vibrio injensis]